MSVISSIAVAALSISGTLTNDVVEKKSYNFLDPLGYTEYNLANENNFYSYNENVISSISSGDISSGSNVHVLTHGMGGNADHWLVKLENNLYLETNYSLPFVLSNSNTRVDDLGYRLEEQDLFIYKFNHIVDNNIWSASLSKLVPAEEPNQYKFVSYQYIDEDAINGQIVLIYEGPMGGDYDYLSNDEAYSRFASSLNVVLSEIQCLQDGYLPSINLIGHSRGGIINLLYAYNYREIVNNLISLGTPYLGSTYAQLYVDFFQNVLGDSALNGYDDILNSDIYNEYIDYISEIDPYINSYAIGFSLTPGFLFNSLAEYFNLYEHIYYFFYENLGHIFDEDECEEITSFIFQIISIILGENNQDNSETMNAYSLENDFVEPLINSLNSLLNQVSGLSEVILNLFSVLDNDFDEEQLPPVVKTDICVDLLSQLGLILEENEEEEEEEVNIWDSYAFDDRSEILFSSDPPNIIDEYHCSNSELPWVPHNFETKNPTAITNIIEFLNNNDGFHVHRYDTFISTSTHKIKCLCGITQHEEENHSYIFINNDHTTHYKKCSFEPCSFYVLEEHDNNYEYINFNYHSQECIYCHNIQLSRHLINVYVFDNFNTHTSYCVCGLVGETFPHTISPFTGKCTYCGMPITVPEFPPIILNN